MLKITHTHTQTIICFFVFPSQDPKLIILTTSKKYYSFLYSVVYRSEVYAGVLLLV